MELNKYKNDGWGLSVLGFSKLLEIIKNSNKEELNVLEFGSGYSTKFLVDVNNEKIKKLKILSFDDNERFMYKPSNEEINFLTVKLTKLIEYSDNEVNTMFLDKQINKNFGKYRIEEPNVSQKNCFYEINENDFNDNFDIVLLDGPNGNGRNIAFLHLKNFLKKGSYVYIDDFNHYNFLEMCEKMFVFEEIYKHSEGIGNGKDNFIIIKIV